MDTEAVRQRLIESRKNSVAAFQRFSETLSDGVSVNDTEIDTEIDTV